jgi:mono/diheme cytochrome c family protein
VDDIALELLRNNSTDIEAREKLRQWMQARRIYLSASVSSAGMVASVATTFQDLKRPADRYRAYRSRSKLISQLDFGFLPIEHSRRGWYEEKLKDPRIFDVGRVKRPEELLKMPNFHFGEKDVEMISGVLVSMVKDPVPLEMRDKTNQAIADGRQLIAEKNCRGCHMVEGAGGDIRPTKEQAQWPPNLNTEGAKTQPKWLHPFLEDPSMVKLRPWLVARMPTFHFTEQQAATIERYFSA